ncbi:hypothetical protein HPT25_14780 [Bacillus sp. BRMEA1]|uniref:hypothetical protein n=1 Tax=Neobacillus endophyticus TaxID=2738405 RepID=UPI001564B209|nr:hypothetical protein [Neobacillus endophyticus]NRD78623.1 hypothetical protein [Neobacillus endophyticus]
MEVNNEDQIAYYKRLESEMNKTIHAFANCRTFTRAFGKAFDAHLKRVRIQRRLTTKWLKCANIPNKDEIAIISEKMVECEEKIDMLDETIYLAALTFKENQSKLRMLRNACEEMLNLLEKEVKEIQVRKIKSLESDLRELQHLFNMEMMDMEE